MNIVKDSSAGWNKKTSGAASGAMDSAVREWDCRSLSWIADRLIPFGFYVENPLILFFWIEKEQRGHPSCSPVMLSC